MKRKKRRKNFNKRTRCPKCGNETGIKKECASKENPGINSFECPSCGHEWVGGSYN